MTEQTVDLDLRRPAYGCGDEALQRVGGLPVVVLPLGMDQKPMMQGRAVETYDSFRDALAWGYRLSTCYVVRIIAATRQ